ncbi:hypothetical protein QFZ58_001376 [Streptomyces sp. B1I3]|nr:hypothetical protein [Streptomyces sp. B1I3]
MSRPVAGPGRTSREVWWPPRTTRAVGSGEPVVATQDHPASAAGSGHGPWSANSSAHGPGGGRGAGPPPPGGVVGGGRDVAGRHGTGLYRAISVQNDRLRIAGDHRRP